MKKILFVFFILLFSSSLFADDNKKEIDKLFIQLKSALNFENSKKIEDKIWDLWTTHPSKNNLTKLLADGSSAMMDNKLDAAYDKFTKVIELDPNWAEAWNKRATVLYLMGKYELSQADIDKVLMIEKKTFRCTNRPRFSSNSFQRTTKKPLIVTLKLIKFIHL